jgi:hypothetical protein
MTLQIGPYTFRRIKAAGKCSKHTLAAVVGEDDGTLLVRGTEMDTYRTMVIFRVWKPTADDTQGVIALFVCDVDADRPYLCNSYEHVGQHGMADYNHVISRTRPATPADAIDLADELKDRGYMLSTRRRRPSARFMAKWLAMGNS